MTTQSSLFWNMDGEDVAHFHCADNRCRMLEMTFREQVGCRAGWTHEW